MSLLSDNRCVADFKPFASKSRWVRSRASRNLRIMRFNRIVTFANLALVETVVFADDSLPAHSMIRDIGAHNANAIHDRATKVKRSTTSGLPTRPQVTRRASTSASTAYSTTHKPESRVPEHVPGPSGHASPSANRALSSSHSIGSVSSASLATPPAPAGRHSSSLGSPHAPGTPHSGGSMGTAGRHLSSVATHRPPIVTSTPVAVSPKPSLSSSRHSSSSSSSSSSSAASHAALKSTASSNESSSGSAGKPKATDSWTSTARKGDRPKKKRY